MMSFDIQEDLIKCTLKEIHGNLKYPSVIITEKFSFETGEYPKILTDDLCAGSVAVQHVHHTDEVTATQFMSFYIYVESLDDFQHVRTKLNDYSMNYETFYIKPGREQKLITNDVYVKSAILKEIPPGKLTMADELARLESASPFIGPEL